MRGFTQNHRSAHMQINNRLRLLTRSLMFPAVLSGLLYLHVFAIQLIPELIQEGLTHYAILAFGLLFGAITGSLLTLRWEGIGGLIAVVCGFGLAILIYFTAKEDPIAIAFAYGSPFIITGGLFLGCWWQSFCKLGS